MRLPFTRTLLLAAVSLTVAGAGIAFAATLALSSNRLTVFASCYIRTSAADSTVDQGSPTSNFGTSADLYVQSKSGNANRRSFVRLNFSTCSIPSDAEIRSARMGLFLTQEPPSTRTYEARRVTASWVESTVTWNNQPAVAASATSTITTPSIKEVRIEWDVLADVQAYVSASATNNGWRIADQAENSPASPESKWTSKEHGTASWRPSLVITYYP